MDIQERVVELVGAPALAMLGPLERAIGTARASGSLIVYVQLAFRDGAPEVSANNSTFQRLATSKSFLATDPGVQIHAKFRPAPGDVVVVKKRVSAFVGGDLDLVLRANRIESLVLAGIATGGVVLSTVRDAADRDYRLAVLSDACADSDAEVHRVLVEKVFPRQADVLTVTQWAERLAEGSR